MTKYARNLIQCTAGAIVWGGLLGLAEAVYLITSVGLTDSLAPLYAVILYSGIAMPIGMGTGVVLTWFESYRKVDDETAWVLGAFAALAPLGAFILRYLLNKEVYLEQGVPLQGLVGILAVLGAVFLILFFGFRKLLAGRLGFLLNGKGFIRTFALLVVGTGAFAMMPMSDDPWADWEHGKPVPETLEDTPNVLLIMVDTLRADALGTYGKKGNVSPAIDAFAADGIVFEKGYAQASWTRASGASLMTSRLPSGHDTAVKAARLPDDALTYAEVLQEVGVATGALINNINMTSTFNFNQGFDTFVYEAPQYPLFATESVFGLTLYKVVHKVHEKVFGAHKAVQDFYQPADIVLEDAIRFISDNKDSRWSLFVHLMEPHDPYFEHPSVMGSGTQDYNGVGFARAEVEHPSSDPKNIAYLKRIYHDEVTFMDRKLRVFFDWMRQQGIYDNTLVILTSDHGEEFFEHGGFWHGTTLYDEQIHVPIIVKPPGNSYQGRRVPWQVRSIDIVPTITAALNIEKPSSWEGKDMLKDADAYFTTLDTAAQAAKGEAFRQQEIEVIHSAFQELTTATALSVLRTVAKEAGAEDISHLKQADVAVNTQDNGNEGEGSEGAEDPCAAYVQSYSRPAISEENFEGNVLSSIRKDGFKYITANANNPRGLSVEELFDVVTDKGEQENLSGTGTARCGLYPDDRAASLRDEMGLVISASTKGGVKSEQACLSNEEVDRLIALGYMEATQDVNRCE